MKCYHILECPKQQSIADNLYKFLQERNQFQRNDIKFWNFLSKKDLYDLTKHSPDLMDWFACLNLKVREGSFTIWNEQIQTSPHVDAPPVVAKINFPILNTQSTYNVWFDEQGGEIDRVECVSPIVLRSDILHTVEVSPQALFPRIQMSFCFYQEPIQYLE